MQSPVSCEDSESTRAENAFITHPDYQKLLAGAHRRKVNSLRSPAITRHIGFWRPPSPQINRPADQEIQLRKNNIDKYAMDLYAHLQSLEAESTSIDSVRNNYTMEVDGTRLEVLFGRVNNLTDPREEPPAAAPAPDSYKSLGFFFQWHRLDASINIELHTESVEITVTLEAGRDFLRSDVGKHVERDDIYQEFANAFSAIYDVTRVPEAVYRLSHASLFLAIWNVFDIEIFMPLAANNSRLGQRVLDFRGLIVGAGDTVENPAFGLYQKIKRLATGGKRDDDGWFQGGSRCDIRRLGKLLPIITSTLPKNSEITLSTFMNGRAYYATALGERSTYAEGDESPLCYILYEDIATRIELGRLVHLIHHAGAARIAAIMHFEELRRAGDGLRRAEKSLEDAFAALSRSEQSEGADIKEIRDAARDYYKSVEFELAQATQCLADEALEYRIQRSRYYVAQFKDAIKSLAIEGIDGFQKYDEFVLRRLGAVFDSIDRLGEQLARAQRDRGVLLDRLEGMDSLIEETAISEVQKVGDIALFGALLPYYASHVVSTIAEGYISEKVIYLFFFIIGASIALFKAFSPRYPKLSSLFDTQRKAAVRVTLLIIGWAAILWIVSAHMSGAPVGHGDHGASEASLQTAPKPTQSSSPKGQQQQSPLPNTTSNPQANPPQKNTIQKHK